jgi:hypothetical protein
MHRYLIRDAVARQLGVDEMNQGRHLDQSPFHHRFSEAAALLHQMDLQQGGQGGSAVQQNPLDCTDAEQDCPGTSEPSTNGLKLY